jgi:tetratricopeptide (TPR) repeat protein
VFWGNAVGEGTAKDFFISYTAVNESWAKWIAVTLEGAGYTTLLQAWDFPPGTDFIHLMHEATSHSRRTVAVLSPAYFASRFGESEWRVAFAKDPTGEDGLLVPVRVQPCQPPGLLTGRVYIDLVDVDEATARNRLLEGVASTGAHRSTAAFPGGSASLAGTTGRFPGLGPEVSNLPARPRGFVGRGEDLERLHAGLFEGAADRVVPIQAVHGLGGIGKTTLALEYAHRFASDYQLIWWVDAQQPTTATAALAALATQLGVPGSSDQAAMVQTLFDRLRGRSRWLLIYDNAEQPDQLADLLPPGGAGHVLVTSRWSAWRSTASPQRLEVLPRAESVDLLRQHTGAKYEAALDTLADLVGDLPLALEEAAAYLEATQEDLEEYLQLLRDRARELFGQDEPSARGKDSDRRRVATVWSVSLDRIHADAPAAEALLNLCAFLAPEVPRGLPTEHPEVLPPDLAAVVGDRLHYNRTLAVIGEYSLATVSPASIGLHRLVQMVIQARLADTSERSWADAAVRLLRDSFPADSREASSWPRCERLLPHLLAVTGHAEQLGIAHQATGWLLGQASAYLQERGQYRQAKRVAERALAVAEAALGPDHPDVGIRRNNLGTVLQDLGDLAGARTQYERALQITEKALGPDPRVAVMLYRVGRVRADLGDLEAASNAFSKAVQIDTAAYGPDHPEVATDLEPLADVQERQGDLDGAATSRREAQRIRDLH